MASLKHGELYPGLEGYQPVAYAVTQFPLFSLQRCRDFQTRKLACFLILRKLHRTHKIFLKIIFRPCKINLLM